MDNLIRYTGFLSNAIFFQKGLRACSYEARVIRLPMEIYIVSEIFKLTKHLTINGICPVSKLTRLILD